MKKFTLRIIPGYSKKPKNYKMYYIALYDIANERRLPKVLKIFRRYMFWVQNSCFEGELNQTQFEALIKELDKVIKKQEDSILFFSAEHKTRLIKEVFGIEKNEATFFI